MCEQAYSDREWVTAGQLFAECIAQPFEDVREDRHPGRLSIARALADLRRSKDGAYHERDRVVAALTKMFPTFSFLARHPDSDTEWEDDWRWIVFINMEKGQVSWHIHDDELSLFKHLDRRDGEHWDGHTAEEKYARLEAL